MGNKPNKDVVILKVSHLDYNEIIYYKYNLKENKNYKFIDISSGKIFRFIPSGIECSTNSKNWIKIPRTHDLYKFINDLRNSIYDEAKSGGIKLIDNNNNEFDYEITFEF
jgi:hypothetical protein